MNTLEFARDLPQGKATGVWRWTRHAIALGPLVLAVRDAGLAGIWFDGQRHFDGPEPGWTRDDDDPLLRETVQQLDDWCAGRRRDFALRLAPVGTPFQLTVWRGLCDIGHGERLSYGALAGRLGKPLASRAVGAATGRNPISLVIPCHRLVGDKGALTGYAGGLARKAALLDFESGQRALTWDDAAVEALA
ncbi:methylated-DNA--[protein]-cysteine S-methyltransferase [Leptothrix discophora]|uniref:Methylated-DNA--[protein]-cysteine S-methyltransferase n=1 Tax=Leptothrix discophora TaxID=89 RepID=A0ABT9G2T5_LEPDI|nr:methylated-DNA--[protein]-cysteine S-methyltransferase [Leptothrix discophora]MDP4300773.1 methylated-DNA--[protein]-cysteine S-methyltransferase [Leptothrix discophora]